MKKINIDLLLLIVFSFFLFFSNAFAFEIPSPYEEVVPLQEPEDVQTEKYELKITKITAYYSDDTEHEIYNNTSGSDAVDIFNTTPGTNGSAFVTVSNVPVGTIVELEITFSSTITVKGYQNITADATESRLYTDPTVLGPEEGDGWYGKFAANRTTNAQDASIVLPNTPIGFDEGDLTVSLQDLNIEISSDATKSAKLVFDLSDALKFGGVWGNDPLPIIAVPGTPTITDSSGEIL